ncbi:MAG: methyltransferase domain-containing protein [Clostridia bacterium]|nr:methyltransferase domain-containing protein [Clostridia bacterium]
MSKLICPNCGAELEREGRQFRCAAGHSFDCAKEGYVNLLIGSKSGENRGDSRASARARHDFLDRGYYHCLKEAMEERMQGTVLDICCGEGYYDDYPGEFYGFDLSKEMVRLASKRHREDNYQYLVANLSRIPVRDASIDTAIHLFAPFHGPEFSRVLKDDGTLYSVIPGRKHLWELKQVVYDTPYENDEQAPECEELSLVSRETVTDVVSIGREDLKTLFSMTPYYYRTSPEDCARLESVDTLDLTVSFVILAYRKR